MNLTVKIKHRIDTGITELYKIDRHILLMLFRCIIHISFLCYIDELKYRHIVGTQENVSHSPLSSSPL